MDLRGLKGGWDDLVIIRLLKDQRLLIMLKGLACFSFISELTTSYLSSECSGTPARTASNLPVSACPPLSESYPPSADSEVPSPARTTSLASGESQGQSEDM